ncbi:hypothetical protein AVEN_14352-1 [Araneus ventricosus]|uniref:Uncharacterized protein n=1 Tax=Araneus ventricosus TaxID=182803 RepID=A0A4Y2V3Y7_ARAVE|nr:hypothetical protein AVEN_14352-1 [Araneus ventricosus]
MGNSAKSSDHQNSAKSSDYWNPAKSGTPTKALSELHRIPGVRSGYCLNFQRSEFPSVLKVNTSESASGVTSNYSSIISRSCVSCQRE